MAESARKTKIFWKPAENENVAAHLWNQGLRADSPGLIGKVRDTQKLLLPPNRWRVITVSDSIRGVSELMAKWAREKRGRISPPALPYDWPLAVAAQPAPAPVAVATEPSRAAPSGTTEPTEQPLAEIGSSFLRGLDGALKALAGALAGRFLDHLQAELSQLASVRLPEIVNSVLPEHLQHNKLPRVLIMGLKPQQAGLISQEFSSCFDLRFWKEEGVTKLDSMAKNADVVISMTDFITHSQEAHVKDLPSYRRAGGGMSGLRDLLTRLYVEREGAPSNAGRGVHS